MSSTIPTSYEIVQAVAWWLDSHGYHVTRPRVLDAADRLDDTLVFQEFIENLRYARRHSNSIEFAYNDDSFKSVLEASRFPGTAGIHDVVSECFVLLGHGNLAESRRRGSTQDATQEVVSQLRLQGIGDVDDMASEYYGAAARDEAETRRYNRQGTHSMIRSRQARIPAWDKKRIYDWTPDHKDMFFE